MQDAERRLRIALDEQRVAAGEAAGGAGDEAEGGATFLANPYAPMNYDALYDMFRQFRDFAAREVWPPTPAITRCP